MKKLIWVFIACLGLFACQKDSSGEWQKLDMLEYGLPITIMAPDSAIVKTRDLGGGLIKDITVQGNENYYVQIYASQAQTNDMAKLKAGQLAEVKGNRYFSKIIEEQEDGFIYQTVIDSNYVNYGFRFIHLQGDMEYVFQTGLIGNFSEEEARRMYDAVKQ